MKIINYKYGYIFDCSINGKIVVSKYHWKKIVKYLHRAKFDDYGNFFKKIVLEDLERPVKYNNNTFYNIRVNATEKVVKHFKIKGNLKRDNYMFQII